MVRIRQKWSPEEVAALRAGVDKYGAGKWNAILKDQQFGEILISRSNVDLKDKWRNIDPVTNESHSPKGGRRVLGDPNTVKLRDMSLCIGASDSKVDEKPLTVLSATSAASEPGCIERPRSRLNNQILDAEAKTKETNGYSHTAVVPYAEKRAAELQITVGKKVEVSFKKDDYSVWFPATVLEDFDDNSYLVRYLGKKGSKASSRGAIVSLPDIRPQPPPHKSRSFVLLDKVDAFCGVAWTRGLIIKEFADKRFMVSFKHFENQVFSETDLRPHMEWINGEWVDASKSREAYNDAQLRPSKKYKVVNAAENPTSTACETENLNSTPPSKQPSSQEMRTPTSIVCLTDVAVAETPAKGHSSPKTDIKVTNEKNIGENSDASKVVKKRGRPPKIYESSTSVPENVKRRRTPKTDESSTSGVQAAEGIKERDCEKEDIAPSPRDHISCQSPIEGSQEITSDQNGQGHVPARLTIMEKADNSLSEHNGTSPELLEPMNMMEIPMNSSEKVKCTKLFKCYVREGGKRSADPPAETAPLNLDGKVNNACVGIAEGTEEKDCETQDTSILVGCNGTKNVQDNNLSQSPSEGSKSFISDQNGQGHVLASQIIKERAKCNLGEQKRTSPELLEPMSRMEKPTELSEKAKCQVSSDERGSRIVEPSTESPLSVVDGTAEGTEEKDCETQDTPILVGCEGTKNIQDNNPSQSPPEGSKNFISDQNGQGNVLASQTIKERAKSNLGKQKRTSPELLEPMSRMEKPTKLSEKAKCQLSREGGTRITEPSTESPLSVVDGVCLNETVGNQTLPFEKTKLLWDTIESMEVFQLYPQNPHFTSLKDIDEDRREGFALAQMVTFLKIVKKISEPNSFMERVLEKLNMLENDGFDVRMIRDRLTDFLENNLKKQESQIMELKKRKTMIDEEVDETERKLMNLRAMREAAMSKIETEEAAIEARKSLLNSINDRIKIMQHDFEVAAAAPL